MRLTSPALGAIVNFILFGSADVLVGQVGRGILKFILYLVYLVIAGLVVDRTSPQELANWLNVILLLLYATVAPIDGYRTVARANQ